jgi:hypothetical protein
LVKIILKKETPLIKKQAHRDQHFENLKLALQWNRDDLAKSNILNGEEQLETHELFELMEQALLKNRPRFVKLFLEHEDFSLNMFLTYRRLIFLYNSQKLQQLARRSPLFQLYKKEYFPAKDKPIITFNGIKKLLKEYLFEDFKAHFLKELINLNPTQMNSFIEKANAQENSWVSCTGVNS